MTLDTGGTAPAFLGASDATLAIVEERLDVRVDARGDDLSVSGADERVVRGAAELIGQMSAMERDGASPTAAELSSAIEAILLGEPPRVAELARRDVCVAHGGRRIRPYTPGQRAYVDAIEANDITFGIGPAGTGKTYLAAASAVASLKSNSVSRIVLVRPVVEAGEHLGYLPGDLRDKIDPYIRPLYDAFHDLLPAERFARHVERGIIEIAPLAYMRGRTLGASFIILDEAQNTTREQMKMFLTRLGPGSKAVITGDGTQVDLPRGQQSGLRSIEEIIGGVDGVAFCRLTGRDVVRHDIVRRIVRAYEEYEQASNGITS